VKRFLIAAGLALAIHGYFLGTDPAWLKKRPVNRPKSRVVNMTLAYRQPARPKPKTVVKRPEIPVKRPVPVVKKKKHVSVHKPEKPKKISAPVVPEKKPLPQKEVAVLKQEPSEVLTSEPALPPEPELTDISTESSDDLPDFKKEALEEEAPGTDDSAEPSPPVLVAHAMQEAKPLYQNNPPPEYPRLARRRGYEGTVVLKVLVDEKGRVEEMRLFKSSKHRILDKAAMASVKKWEFRPGMRGEEPVKMWVRVPIRFQLK
jgi:protein TonB